MLRVAARRLSSSISSPTWEPARTSSALLASRNPIGGSDSASFISYFFFMPEFPSPTSRGEQHGS